MEEATLNIPSHSNPISDTPEAAPAAPVAAPEAKPEESPTLAPKFAALAKKAKAAQMAQSKLKAERAEIEKARREVEDFNKYKTEARNNPLKALESMGIKYDDLVNFVLNGEKPTQDQEINSVKSEIQKLRQEQEDRELARERQAQEMAQKQYEQTINDFKEKVTSHITGNSEKYELINLHEAGDLVFDTIEEYFNTSGKIMTIDKAAELVESYLEEQIDTTLQKTKKFQSKLAPKQESSAQPQQKGPSPSLNNKVAASSSAPSYLSPRTEQERIQRALAKLSGA